jgi:hypothetical protein
LTIPIARIAHDRSGPGRREGIAGRVREGEHHLFVDAKPWIAAEVERSSAPASAH